MQMDLGDLYSRRARLYPALLTLLPLITVTISAAPSRYRTWWAAIAIFAGSGGAFLLGELARDRGKALEADLWRSWGGSPSLQRLRHRSAENPVSLARVQAELEELLGGRHPLPTAQEESADPPGADAVYRECLLLLRDRTRDRRQYPLVFAENVSYGFRRNLLGLRLFGLTIAATAAGGSVAQALLFSGGGAGSALPIVAACANGALTLFWLLVVRPEWVRTPAEAYADRLLEAVDRAQVSDKARP